MSARRDDAVAQMCAQYVEERIAMQRAIAADLRSRIRQCDEQAELKGKQGWVDASSYYAQRASDLRADLAKVEALTASLRGQR